MDSTKLYIDDWHRDFCVMAFQPCIDGAAASNHIQYKKEFTLQYGTGFTLIDYDRIPFLGTALIPSNSTDLVGFIFTKRELQNLGMTT